MAGFNIAGAATQGAAGMMGINVGQSQISQAVTNPSEVNLQTQAPNWRDQLTGLPKATRSEASMQDEALGLENAQQTIDPTAQKEQAQLSQENSNTAAQIGQTSGNSADQLAALAANQRNYASNTHKLYAESGNRRNERTGNYINAVLPQAAQEENNVLGADRSDWFTNRAMAQQLLSSGRSNVISGTQQVGNSLSSLGGSGGGMPSA